MVCIVQEKSKHNRYRSTMRQMNVALNSNNCKVDYFVTLFSISHSPTKCIQCEHSDDKFFTVDLA